MYLFETPRVSVISTCYIIPLFEADFWIDRTRLQYHLIFWEAQTGTEHLCGCNQLRIEIGAAYRILGGFLTFLLYMD